MELEGDQDQESSTLNLQIKDLINMKNIGLNLKRKLKE